ncbi:MAG: S9 family peptidase, partial [Komagataeibacter saccharivorans]
MTIPPTPRKIPRTITQLGRTRQDEYAWMKDDNWQNVLRDPTLLRADIAEHLHAENAYTDSILSDTQALQAQLVEEMKGRIQQDDTYPAMPHGPFFYQTAYTAGAQYPVYKRHPAAQPQAEQVLLDVNAAAQGHEYYAIATAGHSPDHALFAHAEDTQGSEIYRIRIRRIGDEAETLPPVENCSGAFVFSPDSQLIFWVWRDEHGRPARVYRRRIGTQEDTLVYEEADPGFFVGVDATRSGGWIIISSGNHDTSESWLVPGHDPLASPICAAPRQTGLMYSLYHQGERFIILTNADGAYDFKLMTTPDTAPGRDNWRNLIEHEPGRYITDCMVWSGHIAWRERRDANTRIVTRDLHGATCALEPDEAAYDLTFAGGYEYDTTE